MVDHLRLYVSFQLGGELGDQIVGRLDGHCLAAIHRRLRSSHLLPSGKFKNMILMHLAAWFSQPSTLNLGMSHSQK